MRSAAIFGQKWEFLRRWKDNGRFRTCGRIIKDQNKTVDQGNIFLLRSLQLFFLPLYSLSSCRVLLYISNYLSVINFCAVVVIWQIFRCDGPTRFPFWLTIGFNICFNIAFFFVCYIFNQNLIFSFVVIPHLILDCASVFIFMLLKSLN